MVNGRKTLGFYPNILANGVLTAGMRFNRLKRVVLRLKQMGGLARLLAGALLRFTNFFTWKFLAYHAFPFFDLTIFRFLRVVTVEGNSPVLRTVFRVVLVLKSLRTVH